MFRDVTLQGVIEQTPIPETDMTKQASQFTVTFTNGESRIFLGWNVAGVRSGAFSWLCAYRPADVFIKSVEAAIL